MRCGFGHSGRDAQLELQGMCSTCTSLCVLDTFTHATHALLQRFRDAGPVGELPLTSTRILLISLVNCRRSHMWLQSRGRVPFDPFTLQTRSFSLILTRTDVCCLQVTWQPWLISDVSTIAVAFPRSIVKFSLFPRRTSISRALLK